MKIILTILLSTVFFIAHSQDIITLKTGDQIKCKVVEVGVSEIKYKKQDSATAALYVIVKSNVFMINYKDGTKDIFNKPSDNYTSTGQEDKHPAEYKSKGFANVTTIALLPSLGASSSVTTSSLNEYNGLALSTSPAIDIQTSFGAFINSYFSIGGGIGIDLYSGNQIPFIYIDPRVSFVKGQITPTAALNVGYGISVSNLWSGYSGAMFGIEGGVKVFLTKNVAYLFSIGYKRQSLINSTIETYNSSTFQYTKGNTIELSSFVLRTGFQF